MNAENRLWIVSVRSKKDQHHVEAANVKEDDGKLIFTDVQGNPTGSFYLAEVQGYSAEPVPLPSKLTVEFVKPAEPPETKT